MYMRADIEELAGELAKANERRQQIVRPAYILVESGWP